MLTTQISGVIFDMDGVLIDSEPAWQQAEHQVMVDLGVPLSFEDTEQTTGLRIDQVVHYWYARHPWVAQGKYDNTLIADKIVAQVASEISQHGQAMAGVIEALKTCQQLGLKIGLATSSSSAIIAAVMTKLNLDDYFEARCSAENLTYGKPHPEVYLNCANALGLAPSNCLRRFIQRPYRRPRRQYADCDHPSTPSGQPSPLGCGTSSAQGFNPVGRLIGTT
jgi:beta-phosphoglucomutase-like phosphatase (HAD superfamily)